jgi:antitoxin VapB
MATARVFKSGNSQAVRLPKAFRLKGPEVEISRRGEEIVLREKPRSRRGLAEALDILAGMPDDAFENIKDERLPEKRKGL